MHSKQKATATKKVLQAKGRRGRGDSKSRPPGAAKHPATLIQQARRDPGSLTPGDVLQLQRTIGNKATGHLLGGVNHRQPKADRFNRQKSPVSLLATNRLAEKGNNRNSLNSFSTFGMKPGAGENDFVFGRTTGELVGDILRPVGTAVGNVVGTVAGALTGVYITSNTTAGPTWNNHGAFRWNVGFNTTGRSGWIIQKMAFTWRANNALGGSIPSPLGQPFYEAWEVSNTGAVTPSRGGTNDFWQIPNLQTALGAVEGHWSATGTLYFTKTDPATQGFTRNNPNTHAHHLLSSTTAPAGLGVARLHRYAQGTWDSTGTTPTHTGSAGP